MQRQDFSQATSTLGNTPNLHIGSYTKEPLYWFIRPRLLLCFEPKNRSLPKSGAHCNLVEQQLDRQSHRWRGV